MAGSDAPDVPAPSDRDGANTGRMAGRQAVRAVSTGRPVGCQVAALERCAGRFLLGVHCWYDWHGSVAVRQKRAYLAAASA